MSELLHDVEDDPTMKTFWCPGCECGHYIKTDRWQWDGNRDAPTVSPSISVQYNGPDAGVDGAPQRRCHFFLRAGVFEYCSDSTHALSGKSVPMEPWP